MAAMIPRLRSAPGRARATAVATLAAVLALASAVAPAPLIPGAPGTASVLAAISSGYLSEGRAPVAPGVQHDWGTVQTSRSGRQVVHLLEVLAGTPEISLEASLAGDRITRLETVSSQALRRSSEGHRAVAAINGDVWSGFDSPTQFAPNGIHIQAGELVTAAPAARPSFGIDASGRPLIGSVLVNASLTWPDGTTSAIDRVNQRRTSPGLVLYTPRFGPVTPKDVGGTDVVLTGVALPLAPTGAHAAVVVEVRPALGGIPIAPDTVVLNGPAGSPLDTLRPGDPLPLNLSITPGWEGVREAIGGRERIVRDGATYISPHPAKADELHPRTALGITAAGDIVMATVDGRESGYSTGVDLAELAQLMLSRGVVQALNMDGGGSTTMAVRLPGDVEVSVVNRPSDGRERPLANSLVVVSSAPTGPLATLDIVPGAATLWEGEATTFTAKGQDAAYNGVPLADGEVTWAVDGPGTISAAGRYSAVAPGTATVAATAREIQGTAAVTVRLDTAAPIARAPTGALVTGAGLDASGIPFRVGWAAATDRGRGVAGYELERYLGGAWVPVPLATATTRSATLALAPGQAQRFRVRAIDWAGNVSAWATGPVLGPRLVQESSSAVRDAGRWKTGSGAAYSGGTVAFAKAASSSARYTFTGRSIGLVATLGPTRGKVRVYVDGRYGATVDLRAPTTQYRVIAWQRTWGSAGTHNVRLVVVGTPGRPRVDLDAFAVLR
jgi:Phosphodiester glycosidase/Bacterial Ig-like domain (group 2)